MVLLLKTQQCVSKKEAHLCVSPCDSFVIEGLKAPQCLSKQGARLCDGWEFSQETDQGFVALSEASNSIQTVSFVERHFLKVFIRVAEFSNVVKSLLVTAQLNTL